MPLAEIRLPIVAVPPVSADAVAIPGVAAPAGGAATATPPTTSAHAPTPVVTAHPTLIQLARLCMTNTVTVQ
jgi:hypothetical protein